jgi:CHAT domain-containing protein
LDRGGLMFRSLPGSAVMENPLLRSGLALAGANARRSGFGEDGILTALEASRLDLRGTRLVVLSACETGLGETHSGDGVSGLRRGLLLAGARTQIASLWKVADLPTKELMVQFYQHLGEGSGRSAALRRAQNEMRATPGQSHPYHWASFMAIGDWTAIP